ncbi:hypothetical protein AVCANL279_01770 [Campylobacter canadensis]|uniref:hypothetical protein n=1 Tax=Campylobacter canadensis TaxID=449520 RepID=UPI0015571FB9|nr:hypothetical protein [Campylobacter canadensis]MBZ7994362.1 hypothetical protein [Campylobacter canadensis]MBZ7996059.1 hypothetical protein [Campylobacter canadensis]MBZ7999695.1 hypothetical protein [Campylobacter canadensis]MBZ8001490.1 hypothetical protein [Campylobacter canadensis]MBZ8003936.1 hypothetical protein [Campylobacter canadensis]
MKKNILFSVFIGILFLLIIILMFVGKSDLSQQTFTFDDTNFFNQSESQNKKNTSWYNTTKNNSKKDYSIFANELYMHFDLKNSDDLEKKKFYQILIDRNDPYSLFCVKQNIDSLKLKFFLLNAKNNTQIFVDSSDISIIYVLIENLKAQNIKSSFKEIWL